MRCADCETEPLNPRYCECCGREISLYESQAEEMPLLGEQADAADAVSGSDDWAPNPNPTSDLRYEAHHTPSLNEETDQATPAGNEVTSSAEAQLVEETVSPASTTPTESSRDASNRTSVAKTDAQPAQPEAETTPVKEKVAVASAKSVVQRSPAVTTRRPIVPANVPVIPEHQRYSTKVAIAAVVIGAVLVGAPWLRVHKESVVARVKQLANVVSNDEVPQVADAANQPLPTELPAAAPRAVPDRESALPKGRPAVSTTPVQERKPTTTPLPEASAPSRPKPVSPARPPRPAPVKAVAGKPVLAKESPREAPAVLEARPSAPAVAPPVVEVAAAPPPASRPEAVGPFFEPNQVNESPRMVTRVEPRVPDALRDRAAKEVVVVRALVSQSGHPTRISLLRRSKTGPQLDEVVLAAVNQWTFSPAKKKGEPVSCWFNFAVQVGE